MNVSLARLVLYFLQLGAAGFGGPIALTGYMQRDLVERRGWLSREDYVNGLALAQLAPGPLAAQLAMYIGWVRAGAFGAALVGLAFVLPSFLMVLLLSYAYVRAGSVSTWLAAAFYGIGAAVVAIIARSAWKLVTLTVKKDPLLWIIFAVNAVFTAVTERELIVLILASGLIVYLARTVRVRAIASVALWQITWFFLKAGTFVFGSGLAIVPFLYGGVVRELHWLSERQFLDAVAVAMITPGPVVITVAFIGYLVRGVPGACVAALGVFLPTYLFVVIPAPYFSRIAKNEKIAAFVAGVTAAATGAIAGAAVVLGRRALVDIPSVVIAVAVLALIIAAKKIPEPLVILGSGIVGLVLKA